MMNYAWNWNVLFEEPYAGWLISGLQATVLISLAAWAIAVVIGLALGVLGSLPGRIRWLLTVYVSVFRNVPLLVQLFIWFFVVPELLPGEVGRWLKRDLPMPEIWTAIAALGLFTAARVAVQVRSGIAALSRGQRLAAYASGMTLAQAYRYILLPQALRLVLPPMTSEFLTVFKNSALALTIGVFEMTAQSRQIESYTFSGFEAFTAATLVYLSIALCVTAGMRSLEKKLLIPGTQGGRI
ncbi:amino ABC transporter, permease protein, 3-TM region, His/Glu/Gln/Arg/opine family domain protein 1 [Achromobacter xylosoxidans A8]|uniref:Amino ABC transporter, permease protein, 3-TM region, His/Glu/Gln/Arg/opine family domain protein 1 n=2 Tax=Alcaligenes xylosoxydans xylosoxydans TaxID=85698 RepID=E3HLS1_ACHXA|nr:amino ABC transporter, permease protein, 3-TM region, His/Glu/Gln/Arg/opine family domain protein 1 [Achromobacter xylosoxidans A8]